MCLCVEIVKRRFKSYTSLSMHRYRKMSQTVNCAYARVGVRTLVTKHTIPRRGLQVGGMIKVFDDFQKQFPQFTLDYNTARKRFPVVNKTFNPKDNYQNAKDNYRTTFALSKWDALSDTEKKQHSLRVCQACTSMYGGIIDLYPTTHTSETNGDPHSHSHSVTVVVEPQASAKEVGTQILNKVGAFVERQFGTLLQDVLANTPHSGLTKKPTSTEMQAQKRKIEREFRNRIEEEYKENDLELVMGNRTSWSMYDRGRKTEGLGKRKSSTDTADSTPEKIQSQ